RALVRALLEGSRRAGTSGGCHVRGGCQSVAHLGGVATAAGDRGAAAVLPGGRPALVRASDRGERLREVCLRPRAPGPVPPPADPGDVHAGGLRLAQLARRGSTIRG